jgi:2-amino-4-hydroxy-6-hydroxymethyldihydropteridine diphosphokinase
MKSGRPSSENKIEVYLALGSNVGDREANLREAAAQIRSRVLEVIRESSIYETEPVGFADQRWFLNQVILAKIPVIQVRNHDDPVDELEPAAERAAIALLSKLHNIENEMGRKRTIKNGPRTIDIDLLLFGDAIIGYSKDKKAQPLKEAQIWVPHPRMHERRFVLEPLCELAPEVVHPVLNKTCMEILATLRDDSIVRLFNAPRSGFSV